MTYLIAYLDAGSGSVIIQMLLGGAAALMVSARLWWKRFTDFFRRGDDQAEAERSPSSNP